eukprot:15457893-Alexandrium_andersonii.AAC.1
MYPHEDLAYSGLVASGVLDEANVAPDLDVLSSENRVHTMYVSVVGPNKDEGWFHWGDEFLDALAA